MDIQKFSVDFIGIALIVSAIIFGSFYYYAQLANTKDVLSVTGSAKTKVASDQAKLVVSLARTVSVSNLSYGYGQIANDLKLSEKLLTDAGISATDIIESPVSMYQNYSNDKTAETSYNLGQTLTVQSNDVNKITEISKKIPDLASQGAIVSVQSLEYYYSGLPDLRVSLLSDAIKDAKLRAEKIAEGTGRKVGSVQEASSGVVQVLTPNSVEVSDYGSYDTSSIEKEVM
jgi:hypothetical protein